MEVLSEATRSHEPSAAFEGDTGRTRGRWQDAVTAPGSAGSREHDVSTIDGRDNLSPRGRGPPRAVRYHAGTMPPAGTIPPAATVPPAAAAPPAAQPLVEIRDLTRVFVEGGRERTVLRGARAAIGRGELAVLVGRSGSGKSTLLTLLARPALPH